MALLLTGKSATLFALDMVILKITPNAYIIINEYIFKPWCIILDFSTFTSLELTTP